MVAAKLSWNMSNAGYKHRPGAFVSSYLCKACKHIFYDNPYLPIRIGISCPWCGMSHYAENYKGAGRKRGSLGARVRQITAVIAELQALPSTPERAIAIDTLLNLATSLMI